MDLEQALAILELDKTATKADADRSRRELAAVWHPDRFGHNPKLARRAGEHLKQINLAHQVVTEHLKGHGAAPGPAADGAAREKAASAYAFAARRGKPPGRPEPVAKKFRFSRLVVPLGLVLAAGLVALDVWDRKAHPPVSATSVLVHMKAGRFQAALAEVNRLLEKKPESGGDLVLRAQIFYHLQNPDAACRDAEAACDAGTCGLLIDWRKKGICPHDRP